MIEQFSEDSNFLLSDFPSYQKWITQVITTEGFQVGDINYVFVSDDYLLKINQEYLQHNYYTDIITFDYVDEHVISSDILISIDRVEANAETFKVAFSEELKRVMVHGVLHLCGHADASPAEKTDMRNLEEHYMAMFAQS